VFTRCNTALTLSPEKLFAVKPAFKSKGTVQSTSPRLRLIGRGAMQNRDGFTWVNAHAMLHLGHAERIAVPRGQTSVDKAYDADERRSLQRWNRLSTCPSLYPAQHPISGLIERPSPNKL
jgi:hypothetical protein